MQLAFTRCTFGGDEKIFSPVESKGLELGQGLIKTLSDSLDFEADEVLGHIDGPFVESLFILPWTKILLTSQHRLKHKEGGSKQWPLRDA